MYYCSIAGLVKTVVFSFSLGKNLTTIALKQDAYTLGEKFKKFLAAPDEATDFLMYGLTVKNNTTTNKLAIKLALNIPKITANHLSIIDFGSILNKIKKASLTNLKAIIIMPLKNIKAITSAAPVESVTVEAMTLETLL